MYDKIFESIMLDVNSEPEFPLDFLAPERKQQNGITTLLHRYQTICYYTKAGVVSSENNMDYIYIPIEDFETKATNLPDDVEEAKKSISKMNADLYSQLSYAAWSCILEAAKSNDAINRSDFNPKGKIDQLFISELAAQHFFGYSDRFNSIDNLTYKGVKLNVLKELNPFFDMMNSYIVGLSLEEDQRFLNPIRYEPTLETVGNKMQFTTRQGFGILDTREYPVFISL